MINKIIEFFENEPDIYEACIEELDCYNGFLGDNRIYYMEDLPELFQCNDIFNLLNRAFYGYHEYKPFEYYDHSREREQFNPNAEYFYFNAYGNLVSCNEKDYSYFLDPDLIQRFAEHRSQIDTIDSTEELKKLFDDLERSADNGNN